MLKMLGTVILSIVLLTGTACGLQPQAAAAREQATFVVS